MRITTIMLALVLAAGGATAARQDEVVLAVPDRSNSTPWIAASGSFVAVVWGAAAAGKGDVMLAVSRDGGRSFGSPVRVNAAPGEARISGEIAPRVALLPRGAGDPQITVLWNAKDTPLRDAATHVKTARSVDGGRTFEPPTSLQAGGSPGDRGWQALALTAGGAAHAIWLDHRGMAAAKPGAATEHKGEHDGVAMAQRSGLYYASIAGGRATERELFKGVCYCCKTAIATGPKGEIFAAWRHVFAGNYRDMGFTVSRDGGRSFSPLVRVSEDGWSINGCPDDGPAMAVDAAGTVHLVWPTVIGGAEGAILYASSRDGRAFSKPIRVPTSGGPKPSHPQIVVDGKGGITVGWDEVIDGRRTVALRRVMTGAGGATFGEVVSFAGQGPSIYPALAATSAGVVAAWTSGTPDRSVIAVRRLP
jgi:hypothetical protein